MREKFNPYKKIRELSPEEFKEIPLVECFFEFDPTAKNNFMLEITLVGKNDIYPLREREKVTESDVLIAFPNLSLMEIRNAKRLKAQFPLRIHFGASSNNNTLGYFARFELIINENRKMISGIIRNTAMEYILANYTAMLPYLYWADGARPLDILNAFELMRQRERSSNYE